MTVTTIEQQITAEAMGRGAAQKASELVDLVALVHQRQPKVVVEIGTMRGGTLCAWCACAADDALIVSVDLPGGDWGGGYTDADIPRLMGFAREQQRVALVRGDSHQPDVRAHVTDALAGQLVDFLFIDGDHTLEGVTADFADFSPLVRPGGLIGFHDILPHPHVPGCQVEAFWRREIRGRYKNEWEFTVDGDERGYGPWGGIGVIEQEADSAGR